MKVLPDHEVMGHLKDAPRELLVRGFNVLVKRHKNAIVSFLYRYVGDYRTAEDLAQETFLRIFRKVNDYNPSAKFTTWMYTIASNLAKDEFKRRVRHPASSLDWRSGSGADTTRNVPSLAGKSPPPEDVVEGGERRDAVHVALARLEEPEREILLLKDVQGLSYDEIGTILDLPLGTVKSRIARSRMAFKDVWKRLGYA